jgi:hypothetical protein
MDQNIAQVASTPKPMLPIKKMNANHHGLYQFKSEGVTPNSMSNGQTKFSITKHIIEETKNEALKYQKKAMSHKKRASLIELDNLDSGNKLLLDSIPSYQRASVAEGFLNS